MTNLSDEEKFLVEHARSRGVERYVYTEEEYTDLRKAARQLHFSGEFIADLDKNYAFVRDTTRKVMNGTINSITGMCYDIAIRNYAADAQIIEKWTLVAKPGKVGTEVDMKHLKEGR